MEVLESILNITDFSLTEKYVMIVIPIKWALKVTFEQQTIYFVSSEF